MNTRKSREASMFFGRPTAAMISPENTAGISRYDKYQLLGCYFFSIDSILRLPFNLMIILKKKITLIR